MKKNSYFVKKIFLGFLFLNIFTRFGFFINTMIDSFSSGNILGEEALSVVSIISPLFYFISFVSSIIGPGCGVLFAISTGKFEKEKANRYAGFSLIASIFIGIVCALILLIIKESFLAFYNINNQMHDSASSYYNWYIASALIVPLYFSIYYLNLSDGDALFTMIGTIGEITVNAVLSIVLCKYMGVSGLGLSTFLSYIVAFLLNCLHLLSKKNSIKFIPFFKLSMFKEASLYSINSALNSVFIVLVHLVLNKIIINVCGNYYLPIYAVINFAISIFGITSSVGDSARSLCSTYYGENNNCGVKNTIKLCYKAIAIMGLMITIVLFICSSFVYKLFGINSADLIKLSKQATIIVSISAIPFGISCFCYQIYSYINRPLVSLLATFLFNFACPLIFSIMFIYVVGIDGIAIGMCISYFVSTVLFYLYLILKYKKTGFPLYLKETNEISYEYDFDLSNESIVEIRDEISNILSKEHYETKMVDLLFEELFLKMYEKNNHRKVSCECFVFLGDNSARIIIRDNGVIFNFTDQDNHSDSFNTVILNNLLTKVNEKEYLITSSVNRNAFIFRK